MYKLERVKAMLIGFLFISLALILKSAYSDEHAIVFNFVLIIFIVLGPGLLINKLNSQKPEIVKK